MACCSGRKSGGQMVDKRAAKHKTHKLVLWLVFLIVMVFAAVYTALSLISFRNIHKVYDNTPDDATQRRLLSLLLATIVAPACAVIFFTVGTALLLAKSVRETGYTYAFGLLHSSAFWLAILCAWGATFLLSQMDYFDDQWELRPQGDWEHKHTLIAYWTMITGYIAAGMFFLLFLIMFLLRGALRKVRHHDEVHSTSSRDHSDALEAGHLHKGHHAGGVTRSQELRDHSPRATSSKHHQVAPLSAYRLASDAGTGTSETPAIVDARTSSAGDHGSGDATRSVSRFFLFGSKQPKQHKQHVKSSSNDADPVYTGTAAPATPAGNAPVATV